jgi:hypothetical protein
MGKIVEYWLYGWIVLFRFWLFTLILGLILVPVHFASYHIVSSDNMLPLLLSSLITLILAPFAFFIAAHITGCFKENKAEKLDLPIKFTDPDTGIVTEIHEKNN